MSLKDKPQRKKVVKGTEERILWKIAECPQCGGEGTELQSDEQCKESTVVKCSRCKGKGTALVKRKCQNPLKSNRTSWP